MVYGWVRATGLREHDAADVIQEVFRAVFTSIDRFRKERPTDRFRDWLWTITHRRTVDHIRRLASQPLPPAERTPIATCRNCRLTT